MRCANRGGRRHGGNARSNGDEATCAGRRRASRCDENYDWHGRAEKALNNLLCRIEQTARRVQLNNQTLRILCLRLIDTARDVAGRRGSDRSIDIDE